MAIPPEVLLTTCDVYNGFGGAVRTSNVACRFTEQIDEGRPPSQYDNPPQLHLFGAAVAPAASANLVNSGAIAAGQYELICHLCTDDTAAIGKYLVLQHLNAGLSAVLHQWLVPAPGFGRIQVPRLVLAANEQLQVFNGTVAGAVNSTYNVDLYLRLATGSPIWWTQYLDLDDSIDIRDGCTRTAGVDALNYADGDEVRIPSGSNNRYVVVFVTMLSRGLPGQYKRAYLIRHSADWSNPGNV